jgi:uncharacterized membrane protein YagU involved in acid resistance
METVSENRTHIARMKLILLMGLLVGTFDISAAIVDYYIETGNGPENILRFIASGVFGKSAFTNHKSMVFWGLVFHFIISYSFTILFYWLYPKIKFMSSQIIWSSIVYGLFIWLVMIGIVLPLSHIPKQAFHFKVAAKAIIILICMIGFPLSCFMKKYYNKI